ncbi:MAG: haloacid dehalogenase-like hydrolase [Elusimicrobiota bacterium]
MKEKIRIGIDFDNTIVCYDDLLGDLALKRGLTPERMKSKGQIRDYLRRVGREDDWTELQGEAYGASLRDARPFPGAIEFIKRCVGEGISVSIVSHKTLKPFRGPLYDLHRAAREWLEAQGVFDPARVGLDPSQAFFELTKEAKLARIAAIGCSYFIDDLPEFLLEPGFPPGVNRILFDPAGLYAAKPPLRKADSWKEIEEWILDPK